MLTFYFLDTWVKCDDDKISHITAEEVLKLSGGGMPKLNNACYPNLTLIPIIVIMIQSYPTEIFQNTF